MVQNYPYYGPPPFYPYSFGAPFLGSFLGGFLGSSFYRYPYFYPYPRRRYW
ncbi:MAG: hypothetical protein ABS949_15535 [Solibacillus sp.]